MLEGVNAFLFGSTGPREGKHYGIIQNTAKIARHALGRQILRGFWDSIRGGQRK